MEKVKKILIVAGEPSGDQHAANLVKEMRRRNGSFTFWGIGGAALKTKAFF